MGEFLEKKHSFVKNQGRYSLAKNSYFEEIWVGLCFIKSKVFRLFSELYFNWTILKILIKNEKEKKIQHCSGTLRGRIIVFSA